MIRYNIPFYLPDFPDHKPKRQSQFFSLLDFETALPINAFWYLTILTNTISLYDNSTMDPKIETLAKEKFLEAFSKTGVIISGCRAAGVSRAIHKRWVQQDSGFLESCKTAYDEAVDLAEEELRARAVEGVEEIVMYKGEPVWKRDPETGEVLLDDELKPVPFTVPTRSDRLLEIYIKAHKPAYREPKGGVVVQYDPTPREITDQTEGGDEGDGIKVKYVLPEGKTVDGYALAIEGEVVDDDFSDLE